MLITPQTSTQHYSSTGCHSSRERIINQFARITQFCTWPIAYILFHIMFRLTMTGREHFKAVHSPFIIVSNHISFYDSFLFRLILGFATPHLPLRFMAVKKFNSPVMNFFSVVGFVDIVYALFGVFTVIPKKGIEENLKKPIHIIEQGGSIVVYPEGSIMPDGKVGPFRNGAALLAQKTGASVLPLSFRQGNHKFFRRELYVNIGAPHTVARDIPCLEVSQAMWNEVNTLFNT